MIDVTIEEVIFDECTFDGCIFDSCTFIDVSFKKCMFHRCTIINPQYKSGSLNQIVVQECQLIGIIWEQIIDKRQYIQPIDKIEASFLKYNTFYNLDLSRFCFSGNTIQSSEFQECQLIASDFSACNLNETIFDQCNLEKAVFREAHGYSINIFTNKLKQAIFSYPDVIGLLAPLEIVID